MTITPVNTRPSSPANGTSSNEDVSAGSQRTHQEPTGGLSRRQSRAGVSRRSPLPQGLQDIAAAGPTGTLIPGLPNEIASKILPQTAMPFTNGRTIPRSAAKLGKLMEVNRTWLGEINRLATHDPAVRETMIKDRQSWCDDQIRGVVDDQSLSPQQVQQGVAQVLAQTQDVRMDVGEPEWSDGREKKLENRQLALQELSRQTDMKTLTLAAYEFAAASSAVLISAIESTLANNPALEDVNVHLTNSGITAANAASLVAPMAGRPVSTLWLQGNPLGLDGALALADHLPAIDLKRLVLSECALGDDGVGALLGALPQGLQKLSLDENAITNAGAARIVETLPSTKLDSVDLRRNDIDDDFKALLRAEQPKNALGKTVQILT